MPLMTSVLRYAVATVGFLPNAVRMLQWLLLLHLSHSQSHAQHTVACCMYKPRPPRLNDAAVPTINLQFPLQGNPATQAAAICKH